MAKYALLNCWVDENRGDLGIMIATAEGIRRMDAHAEIIGVSCFHKGDDIYAHSHKVIKRYLDGFFPAICGVLSIRVEGRDIRHPAWKAACMLAEELRMGLVFILPKKIAMLFLTRDERATLGALQSCDMTISKGGSVFNDEGTLRGSLALRRLCRMYRLLVKFGCPYCILGQSIGPAVFALSVREINRVLDSAKYVFLRETVCVREYPQLHLAADNVSFSNDTAFLLEPQPIFPDPLAGMQGTHIGLTVRPIDADVEGYAVIMADMIQYMIETYKANIHIFQQVKAADDPDDRMAEAILSLLPKEARSYVTYHKEDLLPQELCWYYGLMDAMIGTRLHSTIFAMRAGTPALCLVYHGTKAQGIFENIGVSELVVQAPLSLTLLIGRFAYLMDNREGLKQTIRQGVSQAQTEMRAAMELIIADATAYANKKQEANL